MDFGAVGQGFQAALTVENIVVCFFGVLLGTVFGLLPGLGAATGIAILLPITFAWEPTSALILLAGIYYGTQYGGTISSVLIATPGDASTVVTVIDGHALARRGEAGLALATAAIASFIAGTLSVVLLMVAAPLFSSVALNFGPPEMFALIVMGLFTVGGFSEGSLAKGVAAAFMGAAISSIGIDPQTGVGRFVEGNLQLLGGIGFIEVIIGLFAIGEVLDQVSRGEMPRIKSTGLRLRLSRADLRRIAAPSLRGGAVGFVTGVLPGAGAALASFFAYDVERRIGVRRGRGDEFGRGALEGVAGPEAANNAAVNGAFVPTLTLGIPGSGATAILLGAFISFGLQPGPLLLQEQPTLVWALLASFYVGNVILLVLNLPMAPVFASLLRLPHSYIYPTIVVLGFAGAYAIERRFWGIGIALIFGILGALMKRYGWPRAPLILGLILGTLLEKALIQTMAMGRGSIAIVFDRPVALALLAVTFLMLAGAAFSRGRKLFRGPTAEE